MSLTYGFYNSINGDRKYNAEQLSSLFDGIIKDGVFMSIADAMLVVATNGMFVNVSPGRAWFNGTWTNIDALLPVAIEQSELILHRIDVVVLEVNNTTNVRANSIKVVKGVPSSNPQVPVLTNTALVHQHPLANVLVSAGVTSITADKITNRIGTTACPFITGVLATLDAEVLMTQWNAAYNTWLTGINIESGTLMTDINNQFQVLLSQKGSEADTQLQAHEVEFENWFSSIIDILDENVAANLTSRVVLLEAEDVKIKETVASLEATSPSLPLAPSRFVPTYSAGKVTGGITYVDGVKRKEEIITYTGDNITGMTTKIYNTDGTVVAKQTTDSVIYTNSVITDFIRVVNL